MTASTTMRAASGGRPPGTAVRREPLSRKRQDELRRRAGVVYLLLAGTQGEQGAAIGRDRSTLSHRRAGQGGLANVLLEVAGLEAEGKSTTGYVTAILETQIEAKALRAGGAPLAEVSRAEAHADAEEDLAEHSHYAGEPDGTRRWFRALLSAAAESLRCAATIAPQVRS